MTAFTKENLKFDGYYVQYHTPQGDRKFVARFKYRGLPISAGPFMTLLRKRFTVEQWFDLVESGLAPLEIVKEYAFDWYRARMNKFYKREVIDAHGNLVR